MYCQSYWPKAVYSDLLFWRHDVLMGTNGIYPRFTDTEMDFVLVCAVFAGALNCAPPETHQEIHETVAQLRELSIWAEDEKPIDPSNHYQQLVAEMTLRYGRHVADTLIEYVKTWQMWEDYPRDFSRQELEEFADKLPIIVEKILRSLHINSNKIDKEAEPRRPFGSLGSEPPEDEPS